MCWNFECNLILNCVVNSLAGDIRIIDIRDFICFLCKLSDQFYIAFIFPYSAKRKIRVIIRPFYEFISVFSWCRNGIFAVENDLNGLIVQGGSLCLQYNIKFLSCPRCLYSYVSCHGNRRIIIPTGKLISRLQGLRECNSRSLVNNQRLTLCSAVGIKCDGNCLFSDDFYGVVRCCQRILNSNIQNIFSRLKSHNSFLKLGFHISRGKQAPLCIFIYLNIFSQVY